MTNILALMIGIAYALILYFITKGLMKLVFRFVREPWWVVFTIIVGAVMSMATHVYVKLYIALLLEFGILH